MASILTIFGTGEGQTAKVAERIDAALRAHGHESTTVNVKEIDPDREVNDFDAVLVGASIHMGRQQKAVRKFVKANRDALAMKPNGFFQVSGSSGAGTEEGAVEAARYVDEFVEATNCTLRSDEARNVPGSERLQDGSSEQREGRVQRSL